MTQGRPTIFYGTCVGGPWNRKQLAHAVSTYAVAMELGKPIPGLQTGAVNPGDDIELASYDWNGTEWIWCPPQKEPT